MRQLICIALQHLELNPVEKHLLFFGFVRKYKGLDILLKALSDERLKDVKLIVAGEFYDDPQEYHDLITDLGIQNQVILRSDFIPSLISSTENGAIIHIVLINWSKFSF